MPGDCEPGVAVGEGTFDRGWESRLNIDVTVGAAFVTAYEVCDVRSGGRCGRPSPISSNMESISPSRNGLDVNDLGERAE